MAKQWYYVGNGERKGPLDESAIAALVEAGVIRTDTLTWSEGMQGWAPASDSMGALFQRQQQASIIPRSSASRTRNPSRSRSRRSRPAPPRRRQSLTSSVPYRPMQRRRPRPTIWKMLE